MYQYLGYSCIHLLHIVVIDQYIYRYIIFFVDVILI